MEPRSLRLGWSGMVETDWEFCRVDTEEEGDRSVLATRTDV